MRSGIRAGTVTLKHINTVHRNGKVWRYLRLPGQKPVRLPDLPMDHPDFLAAYAAAMAGHTPRKGAPLGTIAAAIDLYMAGRERNAYRAGYRAIVDRHLSQIRETRGAAMIRHLRPEHIRTDIRQLDPHPGNQRLKVWRLVCAFAVDSGLIPANPAAQVERLKAPKSDGHLPWSRDQITAFRAHWPLGTPQRAAMELIFWTGARISDAVRLGPGMVDRDGVLVFRQSKTGDNAYVPWTSALPVWAAGMASDRDTVHAALAAMPSRHMTWVVTVHGKARSVKSIGNWISEAAHAAGIDRSAHGLRKARAVALAEAGATAHQIGAWTGHHTLKEVEHYTRKADRKRAVMGPEQERNTPNSAGGSPNSLK